MKSIFMFRRDLRLEDNTGLLKALEESDNVIPIFIFNPIQIEKHDFRGENSFAFLLNSLENLDKDLKKKGSRLYCFLGDPVKVLKSISFDTLYFNRDYTPFSIKRDQLLEENFNVVACDDILLNEPQKVLKSDSKPYTIFTPYYNKASEFEVLEPRKCVKNNFFCEDIKDTISIKSIRDEYVDENKDLLLNGGRDEGLKLLEEFSNRISQYDSKRDFPQSDATSKLSAHNKFGTLSPREIYYSLITLPNCEGFIRQLYWRDFFTQIAYHFPHVFGGNFNSKYDGVVWDTDSELFNKWCEGLTGFPIVDAGMRELNTTGYMHNRVRMIVASFLTKDLHIDWRLGEKYFAQKLIDYDPCVNNGSWQWASSTGCDAQPYFRIFNPWRQQVRFDPECVYIKKWIPALRNVSFKDIHSWDSYLSSNKSLVPIDYPKPIVDHAQEKEETLRRFKIST